VLDAVRADASAHGNPQVTFDHRRRCPPEQVVRVGAVSAAHLEHVAEAVRAQQADQRTAALEQRIQADRRAVQEVLRGGHIVRRQHGVEHAQHALVRRVGDGGHLADHDPPRLLVAQHEVGEGAADVDCDPVWHDEHSDGPERPRSMCCQTNIRRDVVFVT
jgi:hypothetical protein